MGSGASTRGPLYTQGVDSQGNAAAPGVTAKSTSGGISQSPFISATAAAANAALVKAGATTLYGYHFSNVSTSWRYVHMYNKASAPTMGTDAAVRVVAVPPGGAITYNGTDIGLAFPLGLALSVTTAPALNDNTVAGIGANDVVGMVDYA